MSKVQETATPTLVESVREAIEQGISEMHVALPGIVQSYDSSTQKVSVKPSLKEGYLDESGARKSEELPVINNVPVAFQGAGQYSITFPIKKGDTVLLVFAEGSLDKWLSQGGVLDPDDDRRNDLSDAVAIPGIRPFNQAISDASDDALVIAGDCVKLGSKSASDPVALKRDLQTLYDAISNAIVVAQDGGESLQTTLIAALDLVMFPQASSKVKAE